MKELRKKEVIIVAGPSASGKSYIMRQLKTKKKNQFKSEILNEADYILSFSKMTMPHEMATLVFTEQIYRALSIKKGSKYHRE